MRVVTANVNGFRAAVRRGALPWLEAVDADVIALQETRCTLAEFEKALADSPLLDYTRYLNEGVAAGRAGVALLVRPGVTVSEPVTVLVPAATREAAAAAEPSAPTVSEPVTVLVPAATREAAAAAESPAPQVCTGRWLEAVVETGSGPVTVVSAYVHSGDETRPEVQAEKYALLQAVTERLRRAREAGEHLTLTGDLNVAHREVDIKNWKGNIGKAGFLVEERAYLDGWFDEGLVVDVVRERVGQRPGPYTWWSYRGKAFDNDAGWRIDYHLVTPELAQRVSGFSIGRAEAYDRRWSDHAAVVVDYP